MQKNHLKSDLTRAGTSATFTTWMPSEDLAPKEEKDETNIFTFTAKWKEDIGHFGPLVFIAPNGIRNKATHKLFCGGSRR